ncbi:MAG: L-asparaginase 1 [Candidatus Kaiserbacteria bacterium]|nr:L-asparaginase 1 [Candidatus Kaiserbacteria bacterium]
MEHITLITTGGTIDKRYGVGLGVRDLYIGKPFALDFLMNMIGVNIKIDHTAQMSRDSLDFTDDDRTWVAQMCKLAQADKILITHGTDTMIQTAGFIHKSGIATRRTIVLTGALQPAIMRNSDAEFNLGLALGACLSLHSGVYIAMNGVYRWDMCIKHPETGMFIPN